MVKSEIQVEIYQTLTVLAKVKRMWLSFRNAKATIISCGCLSNQNLLPISQSTMRTVLTFLSYGPMSACLETDNSSSASRLSSSAIRIKHTISCRTFNLLAQRYKSGRRSLHIRQQGQPELSRGSGLNQYIVLG